MQLSEKELEVLEILEKDARVSIQDMAKMIGIEEAEVNELVRKLQE